MPFLDHSKNKPVADRPNLPADYGVPQNTEGILPWSYVVERMETAKNYWVATVDSHSHPHVTPLWGLWLDETLYFDGSPETRRGRNIDGNPAVTVHLEDGDEAVILQGEAEQIIGPDDDLAERLAEAYRAKYADLGYSPEPDTWDSGGLYVLHLHKVLAWTKFPDTMTRWRFK
jgi:hypothetical protein